MDPPRRFGPDADILAHLVALDLERELMRRGGDGVVAGAAAAPGDEPQVSDGAYGDGR